MMECVRARSICIAIAWIACAWQATGFAQDVLRPNVIVVLVDDLGVMDTSVPFLADEQGRPQKHPLNEFYRTPQLEALAGRGARFSDFYAMSVCSPTRVSLLTGQTSARHHTTQWINPEQSNPGRFGPPDWRWRGLDNNSATLARILQASGYRTIQCGKGHLGPFDSAGSDPRNLGFDVVIGGSAAGQPGSYFGTDRFGNQSGPRERWGVPDLQAYHDQEIYLTEALTREFNQAIRGAVKDGKPFFGYFAHYAVHAPFQLDSRFRDHYQGSPKNLAAFASMVEGVDQSLGDVIEQLESLGVAEQTLILFLGDNGSDAPRGDEHGISSAAPLRGKKGTHYEGGMRVPFVAAWARSAPEHSLHKQWPIVESSLLRDVAAVYDIAPTVLAVAGCDPNSLPQPADGVSLWPALAGAEARGPERDFLMHFPHEHRSSYFTVFRRGHWKLIYHYRRPAGEQVELFDLSTDPSESNNLAGTEKEIVDELSGAMKAALEECGAQLPIADDDDGAF